MQEDGEVAGGDAQAAAAFGARSGLELFEAEGAALALGQVGQAVADGFASFGGCNGLGA